VSAGRARLARARKFASSLSSWMNRTVVKIKIVRGSH
jgi:hypothetical protein